MPSEPEDLPVVPETRNGRCNICGSERGFLVWPGAPERESVSCIDCAATSRYRSIARGLLLALAHITGSSSSAALADLPSEFETTVRILDTQPAFDLTPRIAYPIPKILSSVPWIELTVSTFTPDEARGTVLEGGVVVQDLEELTFESGSFDIVITSDVMEHVRLDGRAHAEIARVLRTGGFYIFTVPHFRNQRDTLVRVQVVDPDDPATDVHLLEPEYHGSATPGEGPVLSYRAYGTVLDEDLEDLGFEVTYDNADHPEVGVFTTELFIARSTR